MIGRENLLKNCGTPDERLALAKIIDLINICQKNHTHVFSDFLDPTKINKFTTALSRGCSVVPFEGSGAISVVKLNFNSGSSLNMSVFGGAFDGERKIIGLCPEYDELSSEDFPITPIQIKHDTRFGKNLSHRDYLGGILGLGLTRGNIGDILINDGYALVFVSTSISSYIDANLSKVGSAKVEVSIVSDVAIPASDNMGVDKPVSLSSLRIDNLISGVYNLSRSKSLSLIDGEKVFVNWTLIKSPSKQGEINDIITVRGFGRMKILDILGASKKGKIRVMVKVF